jgi:hypothetical protein
MQQHFVDGAMQATFQQMHRCKLEVVNAFLERRKHLVD